MPEQAQAARTIELVKITLTMDQPLSVAAPENADIKGVDLPVAKRPTDAAPYIPVSSVVGALREHAARLLPPEQVIDLFGGRDSSDAADDDGARFQPSMIRAMGTTTSFPTSGQPGQSVTARTQTAIDRYRASAATGSMRTRESLPAGTVVDIFLSMVAATPAQVKALQGLLKTWQPIIGGARSVGHGRAHTEQVRHRHLDLAVTSQLAEWLSLAGPADWHCDRWDPWPTGRGTHHPDIRFRFALVADLIVATASKPDSPAPEALAASSIKGIFRSRSELVLRTLGLRACAATVHDAVAGLQPACKADPCLVCRLFGYVGEGKNQAGRRGLLWFHDAKLNDVTTAVRTHVAIDRFTGGQSHGLLFSQQVVESAQFTVGIDFAPSAPDEPLRAVAEALLGIVAVDIHDGYVGFGGGTARGMGSAQLTGEQAAKFRQRWFDALAAVRAAAEHPGPVGAVRAAHDPADQGSLA
ncbi:MAG: RAMP superfamily CRISPR-associated protein [Candidatus Nanopelagicales bacterium]